MASSIRAFLIVNLLLSLTLITSLSVVGNLFLEHRHMQSRVDSRLVEITTRLNSFLEHGYFNLLDTKNNAILAIPLLHQSSDKFNRENTFKPDYSLIQYQVWDRTGKLILRSNGAPHEPMASDSMGFSTITLADSAWRVYRSKNLKTGVITAVGESYAFLQALESRIAQDSIIIMLITYPLLALLIWVIVGRGFNRVNQLSRRIRKDSGHQLKPINYDDVPNEIKPFITELNRLFARLKANMEREKRFAGDAAHELKTPLAALKTQAQVALHTPHDSERKRAIKNLILSVNRSTHIVQQLLTMSKMVPEATLNDLETIDLNKLSRHSIAQLANTAIAKHTDIELVTDHEKITIQGNKTAIEILLRNIIDNAIRYSPPHSYVKVMLKQQAHQTILQIEDNGPGIPTELRERIFERFFRVVGTHSNGSGLGLSIVKTIVDLHQASIDIKTPSSMKGSLISITFPRKMQIKAL